LNNASIGPIPERTRRILDAFNAKRTAPHLLPDRDLFAALQAARDAAARLINADTGEIALATNTSFGLHLAARALQLKRGDRVIVSDREFPANVYPWLMLRKLGVEVELAPCTPEGWPNEDFLLSALRDPRVRVLAISFVQFSNGYRADLKKLSAATRANGSYLVVDGIQGVGNSVLDVRETPVDILACGGQKWLLSPWGSGFVYVRKELIAALEPAITGWMAFEGTDDFSGSPSTTLRSAPTPAASRCHVAVPGFLRVYAIGRAAARDRHQEIAEVTRSLHEPILRWADARGVRVASPRDDRHRSAIVCIAPERAVEAFHAIKRASVVCSLREGAIRLSPHFYNTVGEMEKVVEVLEDVSKHR
jgi:selenocysteine lyase/cysteine desulfurase